jgi:hypothetical protein
MSLVYCRENNLIYTGGHDGTLIAWNFENGYIKYLLHDCDKSCISDSYLKDSKSVDCVSLIPLNDNLATHIRPKEVVSLRNS